MTYDYNIVNNSFSMLEKLASICATPGVEDAVKNKANDMIKRILEKNIEPQVKTLIAEGAGLIL